MRLRLLTGVVLLRGLLLRLLLGTDGAVAVTAPGAYTSENVFTGLLLELQSGLLFD
jgi:hypothetical protein